MSPAPDCHNCGQTLEDWQANIMVDRDAYLKRNRIENLHVLCKECTNELDRKGTGQNYHGFWELRWIKEKPITQLGAFISHIASGSEGGQKDWEYQAIREMSFLIALTFPYEEGRSFLQHIVVEEWDYPGEYLNKLREKHGRGS